MIYPSIVKKMLASLSLLCVLGCAGLKSPASGKAEVTVANATVEQILKALNRQMSIKEYQVRSNSEEKAVYVKPTGSFTYGALYSASPSPHTEALQEVTCKFLPTPQGVRVLGSSRVIENPGSVNEQSASGNQWEVIEQLRGVLQEVKRTLEPKN